jgi:hypothetical protein
MGYRADHRSQTLMAEALLLCQMGWTSVENGSGLGQDFNPTQWVGP